MAAYKQKNVSTTVDTIPLLLPELVGGETTTAPVTLATAECYNVSSKSVEVRALLDVSEITEGKTLTVKALVNGDPVAEKRYTEIGFSCNLSFFAKIGDVLALEFSVDGVPETDTAKIKEGSRVLIQSKQNPSCVC